MTRHRPRLPFALPWAIGQPAMSAYPPGALASLRGNQAAFARRSRLPPIERLKPPRPRHASRKSAPPSTSRAAYHRLPTASTSAVQRWRSHRRQASRRWTLERLAAARR